MLKCFLSSSSPMKSSVDFIIRTDLHSTISRGVGLLSHNVQFFVWENRHCSMYAPCVCSCNLGCQQEIWAVWGQTNMTHSNQNLMPLSFTLQRWWLQQHTSSLFLMCGGTSLRKTRQPTEQVGRDKCFLRVCGVLAFSLFFSFFFCYLVFWFCFCFVFFKLQPSIPLDNSDQC